MRSSPPTVLTRGSTSLGAGLDALLSAVTAQGTLTADALPTSFTDRVRRVRAVSLVSALAVAVTVT